MRTNYFLKTPLPAALLIMICATCLQAQTGAVSSDSTTSVRTSKYRFVDSSGVSISESKPTQSPAHVAVAEPLKISQPEFERPAFEQSSVEEQSNYSGPLDSHRSEFSFPNRDVSTLPQQQVDQVVFQVPAERPVHFAPSAEHVPSTNVPFVATNPHSVTRQSPAAPIVTGHSLMAQPAVPGINDQITYVPAPRKAYYLPVNEADCCDEWAGFSACGGLKAYPGHWGIRCLTGCDPCEVKPADCHACKSKHGCRCHKKSCANYDSCNECGGGCNQCGQSCNNKCGSGHCDRCRRRHDNTGIPGQTTSTYGESDCGCAECAKANPLDGILGLFR